MPLDHKESQSDSDSANTGTNKTEGNGTNSGSGLPSGIARPKTPQAPPAQCPAPNDRQHWWQDRKYVLELCGFAVLFAYTWFACLQWLQIRCTNRLTREAIDGSSYTLQQTLKKMQFQADAMNKVAEQSGLQVDKQEANVQQTKRLANETHAANQNVVESDRPWLGIVIDISDFVAGHTPKKNLTVVNSGRRPALISKLTSDGDYFTNMSENPPYREEHPNQLLIVPGLHFESNVDLFQSGKLEPQLLDDLNRGRRRFFSYAKVEYRDVRSGKKHFTHACVTYHPATLGAAAQFAGCDIYNKGN